MKQSVLMWMLSISRTMALSVSQKAKAAEIQRTGNSLNTKNPNSVLEMIYCKGYRLFRAASELDTTVADLKKKSRMEFKHMQE